MIWVDKGLSITSATLKKVKELSPNTQLIHYSPDDMLNPDNQTIDYLSNIPIYDYHVTTKSYNVSELKELGAKNVVFVNNAFEPTVHRKIGLTPEEYTYFQSKVGFIGFFEQDRFEKMLFLANNGIKVKVWGETWKHLVGKYDNLEIIPINYWGEEYVKVLNGTTINLCFLRKVNRDAQTTRSVEIPACGGFMLAERTEEHLKLFKEGIEADFFFDEQELLKKVVYYLKNTERVNEIRENGYNRCLQHYSNDEMIKKVLEYIK